MATTSFLLKTNFKPSPILQHQTFFDSHGCLAPKPIHIKMKLTNFSSKLTIKCSRNDRPKTGGAIESINGEKSFKDEAFSRSTLLKDTTAAGALLGMLFLCDCTSAFAATGGRMGGRSFSSSSRSSRSSSSSSRSTSTPSSSSSTSFSRPSSSSSSSSSSTSFSRPSSSSSSSSSSTSYSQPSSSSSTSCSRPSSSSSTSYSRPSSSSSSSSSSTRYWSSPPKTSSDLDSDSISSESNYTESTSAPPFPATNLSEAEAWTCVASLVGLSLVGLAAGLSILLENLGIGGNKSCSRSSDSTYNRISVLKLQVGLLGMAQSLQKDLNEIAETTDTSTSEGVRRILMETIRALQQHPDYCISGYSFVVVKGNEEDAEEQFNRFSVGERANFDEETLVNVDSIRKKKNAASSKAHDHDGSHNECIVITILVAAEGDSKLPPIHSLGDLQKALKNLASIPSSKIKAVEVLWTPQAENDTLSKKDLLEKYPQLLPL